ncbi:MAG TPA: VOC family protein [Thermoanaerobaculia bacterium]|nr:VOC family protein [Thermoanaerobaculia bacterium]
MSLNPYLNFDGDCRDAFEHYRSVFGGDFVTLMTFGDGPEGMPVGEGDRDKVTHVSLPIGSSVLMGSDVPSEGPGAGHNVGNNVHVSYEPPSRAAGDEQFTRLADGGTVTMPLGDQFWGAYFGSCTDRFGVNWMFNLRNG